VLTTIFSTIFVLGILIFVHELGHFLVAKWLGVTVLRFSLGFGPKIVGFQRGETEYRLSLIPLGGYVKMLGEGRDDEVPEEQLQSSFSSQPLKKRAAIVISGPFSNLLLAVLIFTCIFATAGIPQLTTDIGMVTPDSPAALAGMQPGDKVLEINGNPIDNWEVLSQTIVEAGKFPLRLTIERAEQVITVEVQPELRGVPNVFGEAIQRPVIGITAAGKLQVKQVNPLMAGYYSVAQTWNMSKLFLLTVVKLIQRVLPMDTLGGPILIAQMAGQQAQEGLLNLIYFMALISVNLAILNLLPIPILDGGHLLLFLLEGILRRPLNPKRVEFAQKVGMLLLVVLMAFVFYNDIMRLLPAAKESLVP
jgi:regulator of sigma E protease